MTAKDENDSADQNFMSVQEQIDQESNYMQLDTDDKYDAQSKKIKNLAAGVLDHEAVRVDQMLPYQTAAAASASAAAASAAAAASDAADTAADLVLTDADQQTVAADKAIVAADKATVNTDKGIVAADKATVAADKATVAADKATTLGYKNDAETAKTAAETAETNAETAETLAEDWASKAEDSIVADGKYSSYHWAQKADEWTNDALHDNQANEFSAVAEKTSPVDNDIFLIEDSEASYVKKKLKMTNILAGSTAAGTAFDDANFDKFLDGADESTEYLQDVLDLIDEQAVEVVEQAAEPSTTYPGLIWIDTDDQVNPNSDADAIHDNTPGEIALVTEKVTPVSADLLLMEDSAASNAKKRIQVGNLPYAPTTHYHDNLVMFSHRQSSGTSGGTATTGAWNTCPINTEDYDPNGWASVSTNLITLAAGTYEFDAFQAVYKTSGSMIRLYNNSDTAVVSAGPYVMAKVGDNVGLVCVCSGVFTIATSKNFYLQYRVNSTQSTNGLGVAMSWGEEVYAMVKFRRII
jgi:hypothetical protein